MNEIQMTLVGNVVDDPTVRTTAGGHKVANFRVASTPRRFDRESGRWVDGTTFFVTVSAWRNLADGVEGSLRKGQPVLIMGRYQTRQYEVNETLRLSHELEATSIGHDLNRGSTEFHKRERITSNNVIDLDEDGVPVDVSGHWVDPETGEVLTGSGEPAAAKQLASVG